MLEAGNEKRPHTKSSAGVCSLSSKAASSLARDLVRQMQEKGKLQRIFKMRKTYLRRQGLRAQHPQDQTQADGDGVLTLNQNKMSQKLNDKILG